MDKTDQPAAPYARHVEEVIEDWQVDPSAGLSSDTVRKRREHFGRNRIRESKRRSLWRIWIAQFRSVVVLILASAGAIAFIFGKETEGIAIAAVILVNCTIGFISEWRAARSMEALSRMGQRHVRVRRAGQEQEVPAESLVPGDICLHEGGDKVSADLRLIEANGLQVDESVLTGESVPVTKRLDPVEPDQPLAERVGMLYRGTTVTEGSAVGVVVAIGMETQLGRIAALAEEAQEQEHTPLERRLDRLGHRLAWVALGAAALVAGAGLLAGRPTLVMIETGIALGVAAIPEGLPFVATIALARGMWLLARKQALINRLPAVETLGTTNLILSDKTGTLTENRMVAAALWTPQSEHDLRPDTANPSSESASDTETDDPWFTRALEIGALCNNASIRDDDQDGKAEASQGDPTEVALLAAATRQGLDRDALLERKPEVREVAFDSDKMMMATVHEVENSFEFAVKGAPQAVIDGCESVAGDPPEPMDGNQREAWNERARELAGRGLRVLALADKQSGSPDDAPYQGLRLLALIGLLDPPREDVRESIQACHRAGIRVIMVTGDQPETASAIAQSLHLTHANGDRDQVLTGQDLGDLDEASDELRERILATSVFARVSPEQKLRLLTFFQAQGHIIAMTGDGVNDAPALKKAEIGVAMGRRGTDAAKESADMVLKNDAFRTILTAVQQGRIIFGNIRKSLMFMLCTNVAEVAAVGVASLLDWPLPIRPLQILFLNVITDVFPALALSVGRGNPEKAMHQPPRDSQEPMLGRPEWWRIGAWSAVMALCVLAALILGVEVCGFSTPQAVTISFLTLGFAKLWFVLNLRDRDSTLLRNDVVANGWIWVAMGACIALLAAAVYVPGLSDLLDTRAPGGKGWLLILGLSAVPAVLGQLRLAFLSADQRD